MDPKNDSPSNSLKAIVAFCGGIVFIAASVVMALRTRHYQVSGQPMPNGKGGFMPIWQGYLMAVVFLSLSPVWFMGCRRFLRSKVN
jgi:hypothetical protein